MKVHRPIRFKGSGPANFSDKSPTLWANITKIFHIHMYFILLSDRMTLQRHQAIMSNLIHVIVYIPQRDPKSCPKINNSILAGQNQIIYIFSDSQREIIRIICSTFLKKLLQYEIIALLFVRLRVFQNFFQNFLLCKSTGHNIKNLKHIN